MGKIYFIRKINYDTIPLTIAYSEYNTYQQVKLPNLVEFTENIIDNIPVLMPMGMMVRPVIGGKVRIITDNDGNKYAMLVDFINNNPIPQADGDCVIGNLIKETYCQFTEKDINIVSNETVNITSTQKITATAEEVSVKATTISFEGTMTLNGDLTVNGNITSTGTVTAEKLVDNSGADGTLVDTGAGASGKSITFSKGIITNAT